MDIVRRSLAPKDHTVAKRSSPSRPDLLGQAGRFGEAKVEPEGIEPSSKRPRYGLSTCVAASLVFDLQLRKGTLPKA